MIVKKLRELLSTMDPNMEVHIYDPSADPVVEFTHNPVERVTSKKIALREDPNGPVMTHDWVVVLETI